MIKRVLECLCCRVLEPSFFHVFESAGLGDRFLGFDSVFRLEIVWVRGLTC